MKAAPRPRQRDARPRAGRAARAVLWLAAFALVFKAAIPWLAAEAASLRGVAVAEICSVYGIAIPVVPGRVAPATAPSAHDHAAHAAHAAHLAHAGTQTSLPADRTDEHHHHDDSGHGSDHCALTALAALAPPTAGCVLESAATSASSGDPATPTAPLARDAEARWAAALAHAPPMRRG